MNYINDMYLAILRVETKSSHFFIRLEVCKLQLLHQQQHTEEEKIQVVVVVTALFVCEMKKLHYFKEKKHCADEGKYLSLFSFLFRISSSQTYKVIIIIMRTTWYYLDTHTKVLLTDHKLYIVKKIRVKFVNQV
jgi:hypothetical protein